MNLLAVDTTIGHGTLALARADGSCETLALTGEWKSSTLHQEIQRLLVSAGLTLSRLDGYAVATGPGAFTAVRVGIATIKGLAEAHGKMVAPMSSLQLLAAAALAQAHCSSPLLLAPLLDARRGQVFAALYEAATPDLSLVVDECVCDLASFLQRLRSFDSKRIHFCMPEGRLFSAQLSDAGWSDAFLLEVSGHAVATALARLGVQRLHEGHGAAPAMTDANYVRPSDAELFWKG